MDDIHCMNNFFLKCEPCLPYNRAVTYDSKNHEDCKNTENYPLDNPNILQPHQVTAL